MSAFPETLGDALAVAQVSPTVSCLALHACRQQQLLDALRPPNWC